MSVHTLKPQDVLVVCQLAILEAKRRAKGAGSESRGAGETPTHARLSKALFLSPSTVFESLKRLRCAKLISTSGEGIRTVEQKLIEFLVYGVPTIYYPRKTEVVRGMVTSVFSPLFRERFTTNMDIPVVWPYSKGKETGEGLLPIYPSIPIACSRNPDLYQVMATVEVLRVGKARERKAAIYQLEEFFDTSLSKSSHPSPPQG